MDHKEEIERRRRKMKLLDAEAARLDAAIRQMQAEYHRLEGEIRMIQSFMPEEVISADNPPENKDDATV